MSEFGPRSFTSTRRRATVMISAPEASIARSVVSMSVYFPVPTIKRLSKLRPAMTSGSECIPFVYPKGAAVVDSDGSRHLRCNHSHEAGSSRMADSRARHARKVAIRTQFASSGSAAISSKTRKTCAFRPGDTTATSSVARDREARTAALFSIHARTPMKRSRMPCVVRLGTWSRRTATTRPSESALND